MKELGSVIAIVFSLAIPIIAIICEAARQINKKKADRDIRQLIIEHQTDLETAKCLVSEPKKPKDDKYTTLRGGCVLVGAGTAALVAYIAGLSGKHDIIFWLIIAFGIGIGLLVSFAVEWKLKAKEKHQEDELQ